MPRASCRRIQAKYGRDSIGGITSSRCTNEETYLVQKLVRAGFAWHNNVDTCARVCHSPTGYGLGTPSANRLARRLPGSGHEGQRDRRHQRQPDGWTSSVRFTDEAPAAPGRASHRCRSAPHRLVRTPHIEADYHLQLRPGTNVAIMNAIAHVVVTEGLVEEDYVRERCDWESFEKWALVGDPSTTPEAMESVTGVPAAAVRRRAVYARDEATTVPFTTAWASPNIAKARPWSWASRTSRWRPATWDAKASVLTRCAAGTTFGARATWAPST